MKLLLFLVLILSSMLANGAANEASSETSKIKKPKFKLEVLDKKGKPIKWRKRRANNQKEYEDFGIDAVVGTSVTFRWGGSGYSGYITNPVVTGNHFTILSSTCNYAYQSCYTYIQFTPPSQGAFTAIHTLTWKGCPTCPEETLVAHLTGYGFDFVEPPVCSPKLKGSIINTDNRTVKEKVTVVGTDIDLYYSSEFASQYYTPYANASMLPNFNPEGWSVSLIHHYNSSSNNLFLGSGQKLKKVPLSTSGGNTLVVEGDEVFVFDSAGKHLETKSALTGFTKYAFTYTSSSKISKITDAFGNETTFTRNTAGELTSITAPHGQITTFTRNLDGLISGITNPNSESYAITYYPDSELIESFTKPGGHVSTFGFKDSGVLEWDAGSGGNFWDFFPVFNGSEMSIDVLSSMGRESGSINERDINGTFMRTKVSSAGFLTEYEEGADRSQITTNSFVTTTTSTQNDEQFGNALKRQSSISETINGLTRLTQFSKNLTLSNPSDPFSYTQIVTTTDVNGVDTVNTFVKSTKTNTLVDPMGVQTTTVFDNFERPISVKLGNDTATTIVYDTIGRIEEQHQGGQNTITYSYDTDGNIATMTNALNQTTSYQYDDAGRRTLITLPDNRTIGYQYNSDGKITQITPPGRPAHGFVYNLFDTLSTYLPPFLSTVTNPNTTYTYNLDKQLTSINRPDGRTLNYQYNLATGLLEYIEFDVTTGQTYTYYPNTEKAQYIESPDGVNSEFTYFGLDRIASETQVKGSESTKVSFGFDNFFRPTSRTIEIDGISQGTVSTTYRNDSQPSQVGQMSLSYDSTSGRLTETTLDKISDERTYDTYGNLQSYTATYNPIGGPVQTLYSFTLTRDAIHRIVSKTETILGTTTTYVYGFDSVGRLTSVTKNGVTDSSYTYDNNSNRTTGSINGSSFTATFDDQDRLLTFNGLSYEYNDNGDLFEIADGSNVTVFTTDSLSRLKSVDINGTTIVDYRLDWEGRRVGRSVNSTLVNRAIYESTYKLSAELNPSTSALKEYFHATGVNSADYMKVGTDYYRIIKDHLGSPRLVVKASDGTVAQRMDYNEWGKVTADTNPGFQAFGFAGGIYDLDTKLVKFGARDYDPNTGRWLSKDPIRFDGGDTNLYGYVLQDPVNGIDPKGTVSPASAIACAVALTVGEGMDIMSNINTALEQQEKAEDEMKKIDGDKKMCAAEKSARKKKILDDYQKKSLLNVADVLSPGKGVAGAAAACAVMAALF